MVPVGAVTTGSIFAMMPLMAQLTENIAFYEEQAKAGAIDPFYYDRLMIYYRKHKEYKKELSLINKALKIFADHFKKQTETMLSVAKSKAAIKRLSEKINRSAGLVDKKGNPHYMPEPILRWMKRKKTVQQKINKSKS
jgi:hypothetical protein